MNNVTIDSTSTDVKDLMKPVTNVVFIMKSGAQIGISTPLSIEDFAELYNKFGSKVKVITSAKSYAVINKRNVDFYHAFPAKKQGGILDNDTPNSVQD